MADRKFLSDLIYNACTSKKVTLLFGARQVGKSTLLKQFLNEQEKKKKQTLRKKRKGIRR